MKNAKHNYLFRKSEILGFVITVSVGLSVPAILNRVSTTFLDAVLLSVIILFPLTVVVVFFWGKHHYSKDTARSLRSALIFSTVSSLATFSFLATIPLNIDRSFSVWMLSTQTPSPGSAPVELSELESSLSLFFDEESGELDRRVEEQLALGNIQLHQTGVTLTARGELLVASFREISRFYELNPKYTLRED